jgi:AcrR family transcriptional regulator
VWRRRPDDAPARNLDEADLLKASGVTKGGFHFHLPSKEALALATLGHKQEQWTGVVMAAVLRRPHALDQLHAMVEASRSTRVAPAPTRLAAVASPAHEGVADDAVGSAGRSRGARLMTALAFSSRSAWRCCQVRTVTLLAPAPISTS